MVRRSVLDRSDGILDRMKRASDKVEDRLAQAATALSEAGVPYAVVGGMAVAAWVATVDEGAVRLTRDVDVLLSRPELNRAKQALEAAGFTYRHVGGIDIFLDTPESKASDAVHVVLVGEPIGSGDPFQISALAEATVLGGVRYVGLEDLVRSKLIAWRDKDRVHLRDMIGVGLIDKSLFQNLPPSLAERLQELLDDPNG